jgi:hypothetical protein
MPFPSLRFEPPQSTLISARDYLSSSRARGRPLRLKHLGLFFYGIKDCLYLGDESQALLPLEGRELPFVFTESCHYPASDCQLPGLVLKCLKRFRQENAEPLEVEEAAPFYAPGNSNLWHWTAENLPKLLALESIGYGGKYIVPLDNPMVRASLEMFRIPPERLLRPDACYRIKLLMLPQRLSGFDLPHFLPLVEFTRNKLLEAAGGELPGGKRCYIRRLGRRKPLNETEVLELLREFDFEVMLPEDLSLPEQWRYMTNVECSVMAHGANSTLILLQKPRSGCVEMFGNRYVSYNNLHAVRLLRLRYRPLVQELSVADAPPGKMSLEDFLWSGFSEDLQVDITHLRIHLESLLT